MSRQVKLVDTGEMSTNDVAFRAPNKKYFSSEAAYIKWNTNKEYRNKCIDKMFEIMSYKPGMILPTYFFKKLKDYEYLGYEALYNTMISQTKSIQWALTNKSFNGETAKVMYIMAILHNNVMDEYKKIVKAQKYKSTGAKADIIFFDEFVQPDGSLKQNQATNISKWLEDED